jgi:hypothetical protein
MVALVLAGCAAPMTWQHPGLDGDAANRQREIDSAECTAVAMQAISLPVLPAMQPSPSASRGYVVSGTATVYGANGDSATGYYSGTVAGNGGDQALEGAQAYQVRANTYLFSQAQRARADFANACMLRRGWVKTSSAPQPPSILSAVAAAPNASPGSMSIDQSPPTPDSGSSQVAVTPYKRFDSWRAGSGR